MSWHGTVHYRIVWLVWNSMERDGMVCSAGFGVIEVRQVGCPPSHLSIGHPTSLFATSSSQSSSSSSPPYISLLQKHLRLCTADHCFSEFLFMCLQLFTLCLFLYVLGFSCHWFHVCVFRIMVKCSDHVLYFTIFVLFTCLCLFVLCVSLCSFYLCIVCMLVCLA